MPNNSGVYYTQIRLVELEKTIIYEIIDMMQNEVYDKGKEEFIDLLKQYYYEVNNFKLERHYRKHSILRFLKFLLVYPVINGVDVNKTLDIYREYWLIDTVTFFIFQITSRKINSRRIDAFLRYVSTSDDKNIITICLFRVNPEYVRSKYVLDVNKLTQKELYYSVANGYYPLLNGTNIAIQKLISDNCTEEINMLKSNGLWINN